MRSLRLCILAFVCTLSAKTPITHEAVWLMKSVGAPAPSPDGKWVVFSVTEPSYDERAQSSDLWIAPADGSAKPRRLTFTKGAESGPAWSPDSRKVAFSARREGDEASQIYLLDVAGGGEAQRVTSVSTGATSPRWSPDGRAIAFNSSVYPGALDDEANKKAAAERKARKYHARIYESFPIRHWDHWLDDRQVHLFVQELGTGAKARDVLAGTQLAAQPGYSGTETNSGQELSVAWTPDGQGLIFAATTRRNQAAYANVNSHLFLAPAAGGEPQQITTGNDSYSKPVFRPDGKALYFLFAREDAKVYHNERLAMLPWPAAATGKAERTVLTADFDRSVNTFAFTPDSRTVYLLAEDAGLEKLYATPADKGAVRVAFEMTTGAYTNLAIPAKASAPMLLANYDSAIHPPEVVRIDAPAGQHRMLSEFNTARAAEIDWQPLRHFWFTSKAGKKVHSMVALPPNFDEKARYPLLVLMHGGPHSMWRDHYFTRWNYHLLAQPGYVVLLTNFTGSTGYGEKFAQDIQLDPFRGPGNEINEAADEAIRLFQFVDGTRQAAAGASYGGHLANWMQASTTRYKCLVAHSGLINLESQWGTSDFIYHREMNNGGPVWEQGKVWREQNPIRYAAQFRTPILLTVGEHDMRVPINQTLENWSVLQRMKVPSKLIVFEDANHWIQKGEDSKFFFSEVEAWLKKYL